MRVCGEQDSIGEYTLGETLGSGSFGNVVFGMHRTSFDRVAIKVLSKDATSDTGIKRVSSEISAMEKTRKGCPFIVQLKEVLIGRNNVFLIMEYIDGGELFKSLFKTRHESDSGVGTPEREERARLYFHQLVMGVHWCHERGVAHRDIKPQNLLLNLNGLLKIADFGFAALLEDGPRAKQGSRSLRTTMCGSPLYMAPELLTLREGYSYNSLCTDAWGCGAVLYTMLEGTPPFPANSFRELVCLASKPRVSLKLPHKMDRHLAILLRSLLRLEPKQRLTLPQVTNSPWFRKNLDMTLNCMPDFEYPFQRRMPKGIAVAASSSSETAPTREGRPRNIVEAADSFISASNRSSRLAPAEPLKEVVQEVDSGKRSAATQILQQQQRRSSTATGFLTSPRPLHSVETRRTSTIQIKSADFRDAANSLANRLRAMIQASRNRGVLLPRRFSHGAIMGERGKSGNCSPRR